MAIFLPFSCSYFSPILLFLFFYQSCSFFPTILLFLFFYHSPAPIFLPFSNSYFSTILLFLFSTILLPCLFFYHSPSMANFLPFSYTFFSTSLLSLFFYLSPVPIFLPSSFFPTFLSVFLILYPPLPQSNTPSSLLPRPGVLRPCPHCVAST